MNKKIDPVVEFFCLEDSELAQEWQDNNGKIRDIDKFQKYLTETFQDPLHYVLETFNHHLEINHEPL